MTAVEMAIGTGMEMILETEMGTGTGMEVAVAQVAVAAVAETASGIDRTASCAPDGC